MLLSSYLQTSKIYKMVRSSHIQLCYFVLTCLWKYFAAMKPHEIQEKLGLTRIRDRNWYVQPACASSGDGLYEGLTWLTSNHKS